MNTPVKTPAIASALIVLASLCSSNEVRGQEAAMVYASDVTATSSLNSIDPKATPAATLPVDGGSRPGTACGYLEL